jgi:hypothetical protein
MSPAVLQTYPEMKMGFLALLRESIVNAEEDLEINVPAVVPKLLNMAAGVRYEALTRAVEAIVQISGEEIWPYENAVVSEMFALCNEALAQDDSEQCAGIMALIFEIINTLPDDSQLLIEISEGALPACIDLLQKFPETTAFDDIFSVISVFHTKIDNVTEVMFTCLGLVLELVLNDSDLMTAMQNIAYLAAPVILSPGFSDRGELVGLTCEAVKTFIDCQMPELDIDNLSYALLMAGALILALGGYCLSFMGAVFQAATIIEDDSGTILFSACVFATSAALFTPNIDFAATFPVEFVDFIIGKMSPAVLQTYPEMKMGFLALLKLAECGRGDAWELCFELLPALADLRREREMNRENRMRTAREVLGQGDATFEPLVIPFALGRLEPVDEFAVFMELAGKQTLTAEQKAICESVFN